MYRSSFLVIGSCHWDGWEGLIDMEIDYLNENPDKQLYWNREAQKIKLSEAEFTQKYKELALAGYIKSTGTKTMIRDWPLGSMRLDERKFKLQLFVREFSGDLKWYYCSSSSPNTSKPSKKVGSNAIKVLRDWLKFNELDSLQKIYGRACIHYKNCVPKGFYYCDGLRNNIPLHHMNSIDACSQYPSGFIGKMPTTKGAQFHYGTVKPNKDYPFAFYINSGHVAIFGEFDTHDWLKTPFANILCPKDDKINKDSPSVFHNYYLDYDKDITVLMKESESNPLEDFFKEQFAIKEKYGSDTEEYKQAKLVLNSLIGCMHYKDYYYNKTNFQFAHLVAVAIARGNNKILNKALEIGVDNIAMIVVDGIIYEGTKKYGEETKALGHFHQEVFDCDYQQKQMSCYMFHKDGKCLKFKHGCFNDDGDGNDIETPSDAIEMEYWRRVVKGENK